MRRSILWTLLRREWMEMIRNRAKAILAEIVLKNPAHLAEIAVVADPIEPSDTSDCLSPSLVKRWRSPTAPVARTDRRRSLAC